VSLRRQEEKASGTAKAALQAWYKNHVKPSCGNKKKKARGTAKASCSLSPEEGVTSFLLSPEEGVISFLLSSEEGAAVLSLEEGVTWFLIFFAGA